MGDPAADCVDDRTIVVAVDGSDAAEAALEWAIAEATEKNCRLLLVYVLTTSDELATALFPLAGAPDAATLGHEVLERAASRCEKAAVPHSARLVEGRRTDMLVDIATDAGMLVLGGHHHSLPPPAGLEPVIQGCLHRCRCPFVLVKAPEGSS